VGLKLNVICHLLAYANDVNLLEDNIDTIKTQKLLTDVTKEVGLKVNAEKNKYMLLLATRTLGKFMK
jgi:hypothetical protein